MWGSSGGQVKGIAKDPLYLIENFRVILSFIQLYFIHHSWNMCVITAHLLTTGWCSEATGEPLGSRNECCRLSLHHWSSDKKKVNYLFIHTFGSSLHIWKKYTVLSLSWSLTRVECVFCVWQLLSWKWHKRTKWGILCYTIFSGAKLHFQLKNSLRYQPFALL